MASILSQTGRGDAKKNTLIQRVEGIPDQRVFCLSTRHTLMRSKECLP